MNGLVRTDSEQMLAELVHNLRQPLSTLQYSACYLQMLLSNTHEAVRQQLRVIEQQLDLANRLVNEAATKMAGSCAQPVATGESLDLTKSQTAAVT